MRKIILYIAASIDGKIATSDGSVKWLETIPNPDKTDYGYEEFFDSIDTTIMGYGTYNQLLSWNIPFPYAGKKNYVITNREDPVKSEYVKFIKPGSIDLFKELKRDKGSDIWLIGGGKTNSLFLKHGLIDELRLFIMPIVLTDGIDLFIPSSRSFQSGFHLVKTLRFSSGVIENRYKIK